MAINVLSWGLEPGEEKLPFPCDDLALESDGTYFRGITIGARPAWVYRWLLQMRVAPYSYDWINNLGRQSPLHLLELAPVATGQRMMIIFNIVGFEPGRSLTLRIRQPSFWRCLFGDIGLSYLIVPVDGDCVRLLVKIHRRFNRDPLGWFMRFFLPWANLFMHRKQLLLFRTLAERSQKY